VKQSMSLSLDNLRHRLQEERARIERALSAPESVFIPDATTTPSSAPSTPRRRPLDGPDPHVHKPTSTSPLECCVF